MIIRDIEAEDLPICLEYLKHEWEYINGTPLGRDKAVLKMERAMMGEIGAVVIDDNKLIGFTVIEEHESAVVVISFYIASEYRISKATYLLMKWVITNSVDKKLIYLPLHSNMVLPSSVCNSGKIDKDRVSKWLDKASCRYTKE